jgi:hypothetical protein
MKINYKLCWFCDKKCYSFVSICSDCLEKKIKKNQTNTFLYKSNIENKKNRI